MENPSELNGVTMIGWAVVGRVESRDVRVGGWWKDRLWRSGCCGLGM